MTRRAGTDSVSGPHSLPPGSRGSETAGLEQLREGPSVAALRSLRRCALAFAALTALVAAAAIVGTVLDIPWLTTVGTGVVSIKMNTAVALVAATVSLILQLVRPRGRGRLAAQGCALIVASIGLLSFAEYLFHVDLGLDQLFWREAAGAAGTVHLGRPAPNTALALSLLGLAQLMLSARFPKSATLVELLSLGALAIATLALLGYIFGAGRFLGLEGYTPIALNTALALFLLSAASLIARPEGALVAALTSRRAGGVFARRLLIPLVVAPLLLSVLVTAGVRAGQYNDRFADALNVVAVMGALLALVWWGARILDRVDTQREKAERQELRLIVEERERRARAAEREARLEALRESDKRFRTMADAIPQLAWMARADGYIDWYNQRWYEYTGTTPQQMEGWGWQSVHDPDTLPNVLERWKASIATGEPFEMEFPLRRADGHFRGFLTRVQPLRDSEGRVVQWFGTSTDVTALAEAQAALRQANEQLLETDRRKNEFLGVLSHELRNPLAPIHNCVYLLNRAGGLNEQATKSLGVIDRQTRHLAKLVDDLLDVTRIARGKVQLRRVKCDLAELVRSAVEDQRAVMGVNQLRVEVNVAPGPVWIEADPTRVSQMIGNLLQNAAKFTPAGGSVSVALSRDDAGRAVVEVADTGVGLDEATLRSLFTPFAQSDRSLARSRGGLGLGLALVKGLADLHGGDVRADSAGPGKGARFWLRFPMVGAHDASVATEPLVARRALAQRGACRKVLVVEDNTDSADTLSEALELAGHEVEVARDGKEAVLRAERFHPDAVLCDIGLPELDGYEVARRLRRTPIGSAALLVALTGYALPEDKRRAEEAGFDEHLAKPPDLAVINQLLAGSGG